GRPGEVTHLAWIHHHHWDTTCVERLHKHLFVSTRGFQDDTFRLNFTQFSDDTRDARIVIADSCGFTASSNSDVQPSLRDVNANELTHVRPPLVPSADARPCTSGLKTPHQLFEL